MDTLSTVLSVGGALFGVGGPIAGFLQVQAQRAKTEGTQAETMKIATELIAKELGEAKGNLVKSAEKLEEASDKLDAARVDLADARAAGEHCTRERAADRERLEACEQKHEDASVDLQLAKNTVVMQGRMLQELSGKFEGLRKASGVTPEQVRSLTPPSFARVEEPLVPRRVRHEDPTLDASDDVTPDFRKPRR